MTLATSAGDIPSFQIRRRTEIKKVPGLVEAGIAGNTERVGCPPVQTCGRCNIPKGDTLWT
ncbi:MAG TPA: hypothetical protein DD811_03550 [Syntrophomonas sp.]|nr:hypothetical protein [Syntrophomonas sp.]